MQDDINNTNSKTAFDMVTRSEVQVCFEIWWKYPNAQVFTIFSGGDINRSEEEMLKFMETRQKDDPETKYKLVKSTSVETLVTYREFV